MLNSFEPINGHSHGHSKRVEDDDRKATTSGSALKIGDLTNNTDTAPPAPVSLPTPMSVAGQASTPIATPATAPATAVTTPASTPGATPGETPAMTASATPTLDSASSAGPDSGVAAHGSQGSHPNIKKEPGATSPNLQKSNKPPSGDQANGSKDSNNENGSSEGTSNGDNGEEEGDDANSSASSPGSSTSSTTVCQNCHTSTTPLWRRDENGQVLCNACGLFLKLHGRRRPISLKTDVIKSRNRSKNNPVAIKRTKNNQQSQLHMPNSPGINGGSPSFAAISPHVGPHGSPLNHPSHGGSPLIHSPMRSAMLHDISHIDHMPLSGPPHSHDHRSQNIAHQARPPTVPSTPSTMFYSNSPSMGPANGHLHGPPTHHHPIQPHMSGPLPMMYGHPHQHQHQQPLQQPPPHQQSLQQPPQPHQQAMPHHQIPPHQQHHQPSGYNSLPGSGRASPKQFGPGPLSDGSVHSPASLPPMSVALQQPQNGVRSVPGRQVPPPLTNTARPGGSPHILTPQSRPQSPVSANSSSNTNGGLALRPLRFSGESMSEQLRPRSPDVKLERIPSLRNIPVGNAGPGPSRDSGPTPPAPISSVNSAPSTSPGAFTNGSASVSSTTTNVNNSNNSNTKGTGSNESSSPQSLSTRISELELINDLLRSRVSQLEASEAAARKAEATIRESELLLRRHVEELQAENKRLREPLENGARESTEPLVKRIKVSELL
ncbi:Gzf3p [Sugiyamaella lignohabitans]|uniref:Gzf3p n=1 Tax=Sugiyamaella lignohabitans TaxID=796027 RepID=A0A161HJ28_9ASCO|nr:Gzf3p [Sugiyamaella lignohabitans]ANB12647.1 Gzf3p [Sugiyamaella lignohabitans]